MGSNPSDFKGPKNPVEQVSWDDCQVFLEKLNARFANGKGRFALPTEAQWEYACRAGNTTKYCFGDDESGLGQYAWYRNNSERKTHPVGEKKPNAWGLYDVHGNVWEWCADWSGYYAVPGGWLPSAGTGTSRVYRGGAWGCDAEGCQLKGRGWERPEYRSNYLGFRASLVPGEAVTEGACQCPPRRQQVLGT